MTALLVAVLVAQAPTLTVVNTRRTGATLDEGLGMATRVATLLGDAGVPIALSANAAAAKLTGLGTKDPGICQGKKACELELARQLEVKVLVTVSVARLGADVGVGVQALRADDGAALATDSLLLVGKSRLLAEQLEPFVERLREGLGLKAPPTAQAPPPPPSLVPKAERPVVLPAPLPPSRSESHVAGVTLLVGAGACVVAAVVLGVLAANAAAETGRLENGHSAHSYEGSRQWASRANGLITATTVTSGAALALGAGALFTW